jgi:hypothetical protein
MSEVFGTRNRNILKVLCFRVTTVVRNEITCFKLRKIWDFHGGDHEEFRLLGYENLVLSSQEAHYLSATGPRRLMLCKIWGELGTTLAVTSNRDTLRKKLIYLCETINFWISTSL